MCKRYEEALEQVHVLGFGGRIFRPTYLLSAISFGPLIWQQPDTELTKCNTRLAPELSRSGHNYKCSASSKKEGRIALLCPSLCLPVQDEAPSSNAWHDFTSSGHHSSFINIIMSFSTCLDRSRRWYLILRTAAKVPFSANLSGLGFLCRNRPPGRDLTHPTRLHGRRLHF